jgi:SAM-dependent methyltransferase
MNQFTALAPHYDELMQIVPYDAWVEYVMLLWSMVEHQPKRVLDCACGTGNVTFELAKQGLDVTGVDLSAGMIAEAKNKASGIHTPLPVRFFQGDLAKFDLGETFDSATCLYDSLNYILDASALQAAFGRIAAHLLPGGVFVFDMNSEYALQADLFTQRSTIPGRRLHYDWKASYDNQARVCSVEMHFSRRNQNGEIEEFSETHRERAYSLREVEAMLDATGWELMRTYNSYTLNKPHDRSERWYFVARKI